MGRQQVPLQGVGELPQLGLGAEAGEELPDLASGARQDVETRAALAAWGAYEAAIVDTQAAWIVAEDLQVESIDRWFGYLPPPGQLVVPVPSITPLPLPPPTVEPSPTAATPTPSPVPTP